MSDDAIQEAMLSLIEACGRWNAFDGPAIVRELRNQRALWRSAILVGPSTRVYVSGTAGDFVREEHDFSAHRGLPDILYGYDILQVAPAPGRENDLDALVRKWSSDSIQWVGLPQAESALEDSDEDNYTQAGGDPRRVIVELWWD